MANAPKSFGSCCEMLKDAMSKEDFDPLINVGEDDQILYMAVGMIDVEDEEPGMVEFPIYFCPFCATRLQTPEEIESKSGSTKN
jgi:hypothetical protein